MNQWSPMPQRYPNQPGAPNFLGSSLSGMPPGAPGTPPMGPYGRMAQRASPQARDKQYMHSSKPQVNFTASFMSSVYFLFIFSVSSFVSFQVLISNVDLIVAIHSAL